MQRVMVVDDDKQVLSLAGRWLSAAGYDAVMLNDFRDARVQLQVCDPSVVVADVRLGSFNGIQLGLLARSVRSDVGVVIISGWDDPVTRRDIEEIGAQYLRKPFRGDALVSAVQAAATQSR